MFCIKCGNPMNENDKFCEVCGAKNEVAANAVQETANVAPQTQVVDNSAVAGETEVLTPEMLQSFEAAQNIDSTADLGQGNDANGFSVDVEQTYYADDTQNGGAVIDSSETVQPEVKTKKKSGKKKRAIIGGIVGTIAAAIAVVCIFAWDYVENFVVETFSSDESYYQYVEGKNVDELASSVGSVVGLLNGETSNFGNNSTVKLQLGDALIDYIAQQSGMNKADIQWLSNVGINTDISSVKGTVAGGVDLLIGDKTALGADIIFDSEAMCMYLCIPQINEKYVMIDMSEMLTDINTSEYDEAMAMLETISSALPDEATTSKLIARYLNVAIEAIDDVEKDSATIKANGVSQSCTKLTYTIDEDAVQDIVEAILKEFKNDKEIKKIVKDVMLATGEIDADDFDDMYDEVIDYVDMLIDEIDDLRIGDFEVEIVTYVDGRGEVIGRELEIEEIDIDFHYYTTHSGDDVGVEMILAADGQKLEFLGSGTLDGDLLDCDYTLSFGGVKMLSIKAVDYDVMKAEDGYTNGKFIISLPEETCDLLERTAGIPDELIELLPNISIEAVIKQSESAASFDVSLKHKSDMIVKLSLSTKDTKPSDIVIPSNAIKVEDENDLEDYASEVDPEKFMQHLKDVGIPDSFFEAITNAMNQENDFVYDEYYGNDYDFGYEYVEPNYDFNYGTSDSYEDVYGGFIY